MHLSVAHILCQQYIYVNHYLHLVSKVNCRLYMFIAPIVDLPFNKAIFKSSEAPFVDLPFNEAIIKSSEAPVVDLPFNGAILKSSEEEYNETVIKKKVVRT